MHGCNTQGSSTSVVRGSDVEIGSDEEVVNTDGDDDGDDDTDDAEDDDDEDDDDVTLTVVSIGVSRVVNGVDEHAVTELSHVVPV
eukprot:m.92847 g.92847  ORF g.92847 m.92847 type:complete len:85 (-) comp26573_c0_seq1:230-484(-)